MPPAQNRRLLPQMTVGIAAGVLIFAQVGLLEVSAAAHQQKLEGVTPVLAVELGGAAQALAKIVQLFRLRRIQIPSRCKAVGEKVVAQLPCLAAEIAVQVMIVQRGAAIVNIAMPAHGAAGAGGNVQDSPEAIAVFRCESSGHQVHRLEDLRAYAGTELRLRVIEK